MTLPRWQISHRALPFPHRNLISNYPQPIITLSISPNLRVRVSYVLGKKKRTEKNTSVWQEEQFSLTTQPFPKSAQCHTQKSSLDPVSIVEKVNKRCIFITASSTFQNPLPEAHSCIISQETLGVPVGIDHLGWVDTKNGDGARSNQCADLASCSAA